MSEKLLDLISEIGNIDRNGINIADHSVKRFSFWIPMEICCPSAMFFANRIYEEPFHRDSFDMLLNTKGTVSCSGDPSEYPKEKRYTLEETKLYGLRIGESDDTTLIENYGIPEIGCS